MDKPMPLDVARSQLEQSLADYARAYDASSTADHAVDRLNASIALQQWRYIEKNGLTDEGRRRMAVGIRACNSILGIET